MAKVAKNQVRDVVSTVKGWVRLIKLGKWALYLGVLVAILAGFTTIPYLTIILAVAGLVIGFLNITSTEGKSFLLSAIALLLVGTAGLEVFAVFGTYIQSILKNILALVGPAALVVALKTVLAVSKPE